MITNSMSHADQSLFKNLLVIQMAAKRTKTLRKVLIAIFILVGMALVIPQDFSMPVEGAGTSDYHPDSFWYYPWGRSVTHKGVDIFAKEPP